MGTLISTYKNNDPWWSIAISQSIAVGVPVVTDWRHTSWVGAEWAFLPIVAQSQKDFYRDATPSREESLQKTVEALDNQSLLLVI
jgi:hypothetical protein